ncbi:hypothetical protein CBER1_05243 [Cercospora berteroae]|uniref:Uncharacterized protein n=1 Tax=Cercospora berteroae TaxID=357750 RepID=A0A2S6BT63_9PEZI|nr:hypothetical protein CBER1_05243 [Cercospora berteroae]
MTDSLRSSGEEVWEDEKDTLLFEGKAIGHRSRVSTRTNILLVIVFLASNLISVLTTYSYTDRHAKNKYSQDLEGTEKAYSHLDRSLSRMDFSNHRPNVTSRWTAPPSPEVDDAWDELGVNDQIFVLPEKLGREVYGFDPRIHAYAPDDFLGEGIPGGFGVFVQGMHDMHCLNVIRKAIYFNKDYYRQFENDTLTPEWDRVSHVRHCLDNIRERIMCSADTGVIPTVWLSQEENYPLFGREHKCYSYDAMMDWFRGWHQSEPNRRIDWNRHLSAPPNAIFTSYDDMA